MRSLALLFPVVLLASAACGGGPEARSATFDTPLPASERRATLRVAIDLAPVSGCDEQFDLSLYQDRGIELIEWDSSGRGCAGRVATVRYLPGRITRAALLERIKKLARKTEALEG